MALTCIVIDRLDVGLYQWTIFYGNDKIESDAGNSSVAECLLDAAGAVPSSELLVEMKYRCMHMGTFSKKELLDYSAVVADRIVSLYSSLTADCF